MATQQKGGKKNRKYGRNKKPVNQALSLYVKGKISFEQYEKMNKN